jgi:acylphosphatase
MRAMTARLHALVSGRVQGVAFRWYARNAAAELGLRGWVRNRRDGRVEVCVEGDRANLEDFAAWLHRGPALARVEDVTVTWGAATGEFPDFRVVGEV